MSKKDRFFVSMAKGDEITADLNKALKELHALKGHLSGSFSEFSEAMKYKALLEKLPTKVDSKADYDKVMGFLKQHGEDFHKVMGYMLKTALTLNLKIEDSTVQEIQRSLEITKSILEKQTTPGPISSKQKHSALKGRNKRLMKELEKEKRPLIKAAIKIANKKLEQLTDAKEKFSSEILKGQETATTYLNLESIKSLPSEIETYKQAVKLQKTFEQVKPALKYIDRIEDVVTNFNKALWSLHTISESCMGKYFFVGKEANNFKSVLDNLPSEINSQEDMSKVMEFQSNQADSFYGYMGEKLKMAESWADGDFKKDVPMIYKKIIKSSEQHLDKVGDTENLEKDYQQKFEDGISESEEDITNQTIGGLSFGKGSRGED